MSSPSTHPNTQPRTNLLLPIAFFLLLWLPSLDAWLHFDRASSFTDRRQPAEFPKLPSGLGGLKPCLAGFEAWFNDHFGCRRQLITWFNQLQKALCGGRTDVLLGRDDWLFFDEYHDLAAYCQGISQFSPQELLALKTTQEARRDWLAQRGIQYVFVVAPNKQTIYPEHLPAWLKPMRPYTKLDQFVDYMRSHSTVAVVDLRPALREAKRIAPTYIKTDSHWTPFGAFVAAQEIVKHLPQNRPEAAPLSLDSFELKKAKLTAGDLVNMLGVYGEDEQVVMTPKANLPSLVQTVDDPKLVVPALFTTNSCAQGTCLLFRDCFGPMLTPFLGYHFKTVISRWSPGGLDSRNVEEDKPTVVISEIVERHLAANKRDIKPPSLLTESRRGD